ncbi:MAG: fabH [Rickettsiaceae bacterium]|jgi:3-oxoacyl-[acyl-carrier-protein] synthase-3|nr:fabH [Rickettsiaceae bacterium]
MNSVIIGCGSYLPEKVLTNTDLEKMVDTNDEWITTRTGITSRHIAAESEATSAMAANAARDAIKSAGINASDIELIIVATTTPDKTFPSTAVITQSLLGIKTGAAFDVQAVCSGFIYALSIADNFIKSGQYKTIMVIGADKMSSILDWQDRNTCVLFGDGAGAVILRGENDKSRGILSTSIYSDGSFESILNTDGGASSSGTVGKVKMQGQEVFKHAVEKMSGSVKDALSKEGLSVSDITSFIPHQANIRILEMVAKKLGLSDDKLVSTVALHANTSAASIPLALCDAYKKGRFKSGDLTVFTAIGGGLTWGTCLLRW